MNKLRCLFGLYFLSAVLLSCQTTTVLQQQQINNERSTPVNARNRAVRKMNNGSIPIQKYSINLMWINRSLNPNQQFISSAKDEQDLVNKLLLPVAKWAEANPDAEVNLWYDSAYTTPHSVENTRVLLDRTLLEKGKLKAQLRDIREIPIVRENPDTFSDQTPVYFRVDLLKPIIIVDSIEREGNDASIFSDLEVGDQRADGLRMGKEELFKANVMQELSEWGLVRGSRSENQFLQLVRDTYMIEAIKQAIVNVNLVRATAALNAPHRAVWLSRLYSAPYHSILRTVFKYYKGIRPGGSIKVLAKIVTPGAKDDEWIDYNVKEHGFAPWGLFISSDNMTPMTEYEGEFLEESSMLALPKVPLLFSRLDLDVRSGHSHQQDTAVPVGRAVSDDGIYRYKLWE